MNYISVCSGIEAATVAWHPLGWHPLLFAEIAAFPSRVLKHHYPAVPNVGDFTAIPARADCDLLVGGTPCQAFSVAGLRGGLSDSRGNLALEFMRLTDRLRPRWLLWENVPGVLSSNGGRDFGAIVGALGELGYGWAYRVLDAQFFGVPQRRRRVFLVGYLGDWRRAAAVLFERHSMRRDTPKGRKTRAEAAPRTEGGARAICVTGDVTHTLASEGADASEDGTGRGTPIVFDTTQITSRENRTRAAPGDPAPTLARGGHPPAVAFHHEQDPISGPVSSALGSGARGMGVLAYQCHGSNVGPMGTLRADNENEGGGVPFFVPKVSHSRGASGDMKGDDTLETYVSPGSRVRRLTPRECERLQGFPDDYTNVPGASDSARYRALGNSMAVPVMRWIGERISTFRSATRAT